MHVILRASDALRRILAPMRTSITLVTLALALGCGGGNRSTHEQSATAQRGGTACPARAREEGRSQGGLCLDESALGRDVVSACTGELAEEGWVHDEVAESTIRESTGRPVVCYHVP